MRVRRLFVLGSLLFWVVESPYAVASDHNLDLFVAPYSSYLKAKGSSIDLGGWHFSVAVSAKHQKEVMKLSFVGDVSVHFWGSDGDKDVTQVTVMVGPRWTFLKERRVMPFVHGMILGATYRTDGSTAPSSVAAALSGGGGFDVVGKLRSTEDNVGARLQVDYIKPLATDQKSSWRASAGVLYRFH